ncbi:MAG: amidohydrolase family protein [Amaricoccus sp.]|uniref:amidohydrolase family protein n=1 Tax=Amaricoccus sp. TaxID=1872485 RepID=UPI0039E6A675
MTAGNPPGDCLIEAGAALIGVDADGQMQTRPAVVIHVRAGVIAAVMPADAVSPELRDLPRHGGAGLVAMPGLVNSHHHFGITPLMAGVPYEPLEFWLPQFRAMRSVGPRLDTLFSAIEMLESGTTTVHHIASSLVGSPEAWHETADAVIGAYGEIGMRAGYSVMLRDRNILTYDGDTGLLSRLAAPLRDWLAPRLYPATTDLRAYLEFHEALARRHAGNPVLRVNYAPANLHWCSDELLEAVADAACRAGAQIHMHLCETRRQAEFARRRFGMSAVRYLERLGFLGENVTFGHCNWLDPGDIETLAGCGCSVCHNASSGLRLGSGRAEVAALVAAGVPVALGLDQSNIADDRDMLLEIKLVWSLHRGTGLYDFRPDAAAVLRQASEHGARTAGYGGLAGRLEPGQRADIVLLDRATIERPFADPQTALSDLVLHRSRREAVRQVFVDGRQVVRDGRVTGIDRDAVLAEISALLRRPPTPQEAEARQMVAQLMPLLRQYYADTLTD